MVREEKCILVRLFRLEISDIDREELEDEDGVIIARIKIPLNNSSAESLRDFVVTCQAQEDKTIIQGILQASSNAV